MKGYLDNILGELPTVFDNAEFSKQDLIAILQGITGYLKAGSNPLDPVDTALELASHFVTQCPLGDLKGLLDNVERWATFGEKYRALRDSNDLNFDEMDIGLFLN